MTRLIRAEFYRVTHSGIFLYIIIGVSLLSLLMGTLDSGSMEDFLDLTLNDARSSLTVTMQMGICMMLSTVIAACCGIGYQNRTSYYEVMDGNSVSSILMSRLLVYVPLTMVTFLLPLFAMLNYLVQNNGVGEFHAMPEYFIVVLCIFLRVISFAVLSTMCFKSLLGAAMPYVRYMTMEMLGFELLLTATLTEPEKLKFCTSLYEWLPMGQLTALSKAELPDDLVMKAIVGMVVEVAVIYLLAYISGKKKAFLK